MNKLLYILRHAKSDWDHAGLVDNQRPLNERGRQDAVRMGRWIKDNGFCPASIYCSPATRAVETVQPVINMCGLSESSVEYSSELYLASLEKLLQILVDIESSPSPVMLVGHNPGLDDLVTYLSDRAPPLTENGKLMTTTCLAQFSMPQKWDSLLNKAKLISITRPKDLN